ncbi:ImmA/IrrE family metallo-endopeptidase [Clostridium ihumii]|uniref:ImmA/IrrE family metallo-endopeptidase n=1 Tax=Clostridium ihumii TaxID=1470356 RepID=UPI00058DB069|nr:ImmA/IrrE family metallo-endopeptidase [Clostridium ihumii]
MTKYEEIVTKAQELGISIYELDSFKGKSGFYFDNVILINKNLTDKEKVCIMYEELGHHFTTYGDISDQRKIENRKKELLARRWGYDQAIKLSHLISAYKNGLKEKFETSEFLDITGDFLEGTLQHYKNKYGAYLEIKDYYIFFEPTINIVHKDEIKQSV